MKIPYTSRIILLLLPVLISAGCYNYKAELLFPQNKCNTDTVTYALMVKPIIQQNCSIIGCHNAATAAAALNLENITALQSIARDGRLTGTITHANGFSPMPKNAPKLDDCSLRKITKWISEGALNN